MLNRIFHSIAMAVVIIHIIVCSEFFASTQLWSYLTLACEVFFVIIFAQYIIQAKVLNSLEKLSIAYFLFLLIVTIAYNLETTNLFALIGRSIEIATLLMIIKLHRNDLTFFLLTGTIVFSVAVYANYYALLLNPEGMLTSDGDVYYLLGTNYNQIGPKVIFAFLFSILLASKYKVALLNAIAVSVIGMISLLIVKSMTSITCLSLLLFIYVNSWSNSLNQVMLKGLLCFFVLFQIFVVFLGNTVSTSETDSFLTFLEKDVTFTGRTFLWEYSADYFLDSPIWGHGNINATDYYESGYFHGIRKTSHNYVYGILHKGGIILLFIFYKLVAISYRRIKGYINQRRAYVIIMAGVVFLVMCLFEIYDSIYTYLLLIFMYYYKDFIAVNNKNRIHENCIRSHSHI